MKKNLVEKNKIFWLVDPFQDNQDYHQHALLSILPLAKALNLSVQPLSFVGVEQLSLNAGSKSRLTFSELMQMIQAAVESRFRQIFSKSQARQFLNPAVLSSKDKQVLGLEQKIAAIDAYCTKNCAEFVALQSHARKGFKRFFMGSFAETFVLTARNSTLLINPACKVNKKFKTIVFSTDFSKESLESFRAAVGYAKKLKVELKVVHCINKPRLSVFLSGKNTAAQLDSEYAKQASKALQIGSRLLKLAKTNNVRSSFHLLESSGAFEPAQQVVEFAGATTSPIIVLAAKSGSLRASLLGATSRKIARQAECPVLIQRLQKSR